MTPEERLKQIDHIVVLMMENRSFDHMLGYLTKHDMPEVRGLQGNESNPGPDGKPIPVHKFHASANKVQRPGEALQKRLDPDHSPKGVAQQIGTNNDGFVKNYVGSRKIATGKDKGKPDTKFPKDLWGVPMGYYTQEDLPAYDFLAHTYCVCDAWHASIPGDTWPNRTYAVAGRQGPSVWKQSDLFEKLKDKPFFKQLRNVPLFTLRAFTNELTLGDWRWYSHDPATLRCVDATYRNPKELYQDNFAWFDRRQMNWVTRTAEESVFDIVAKDSFLDDAAKGQLRKVSWIDPNFVDLDVLDPHSNDDHPPGDILAGQQFVFDVYDALRKSKNWENTLLVVTYDEHGGFYDHVKPPPVEDDGSGYKTLGLRVPALIAGPRVRNFVCHEAFDTEPWDHTALIRSILMRFAKNPAAAMAKLGPRVAQRKAHLGLMLEDKPRNHPPDDTHDALDLRAQAEARLEAWRVRARDARQAAGPDQRSAAPDGAGQDFVLTDFQQEWAGAALALRSSVLPRGT